MQNDNNSNTSNNRLSIGPAFLLIGALSTLLWGVIAVAPIFGVVLFLGGVLALVPYRETKGMSAMRPLGYLLVLTAVAYAVAEFLPSLDVGATVIAMAFGAFLILC